MVDFLFVLRESGVYLNKYQCFCKEWACFTLLATKGKVNGYDVSFSSCVKFTVFCAVEIDGVKEKACAFHALFSQQRKLMHEPTCQKLS